MEPDPDPKSSSGNWKHTPAEWSDRYIATCDATVRNAHFARHRWCRNYVRDFHRAKQKRFSLYGENVCDFLQIELLQIEDTIQRAAVTALPRFVQKCRYEASAILARLGSVEPSRHRL